MKSIYCVCLLTFSVRRLESVFAAWYRPGDVLVGGLYRRRRARPESRDPQQLAAHGILRMRHWPMRVEHPWSFSCFIGFLLQPFRLEIYEIKVFVWEDHIKSFWSLYQFWQRHTKGRLCFVLKLEKHSGGDMVSLRGLCLCIQGGLCSVYLSSGTKNSLPNITQGSEVWVLQSLRD